MTGKLGYMRHQKGSFRGAARTATDRAKSSGIVMGRYDNLRLTEVPQWIYIPPQMYTYNDYDKETKEVVEVADAPFFAAPQHFVANGSTKDKRPGRKGRVHNCSGGPDRSKPCYGCGVRARWYAEKDALQAKGVKRDKKEMPPVGASKTYAMGAVISEIIASVPVLEKNGMQRKSAKGTLIFDRIPAPILKSNGQMLDGLSLSFGRNTHWSFSVTHLEALLRFDDELANSCANCCSDLMAIAWTCPECGEMHEESTGGVDGADLAIGRKETRKCTRCSHTGTFLPELACPGCGNAEEGRLIGCFDLRLQAVPAGGESKGTILELVGIRPAACLAKQPPRGAENVFDRAEYNKMCENPLDIPRIYAPDSLSYQRDNIYDPTLIAGIDPAKTTWRDYNAVVEEDNGEEWLGDNGD